MYRGLTTVRRSAKEGNHFRSAYIKRIAQYTVCPLVGIGTREVVFMERPLEPNMGPSLADVLLCTFESTNAGFSSFSVRKLLF